MTNTTATPPILTPMETQLMQAIERVMEALNHSLFINATVTDEGQQLFGYQWGGSYRTTGPDNDIYYPLVDMMLGRLERKGLVQRHVAQLAQQEGADWSVWSLTSLGRDFLGLPAA